MTFKIKEEIASEIKAIKRDRSNMGNTVDAATFLDYMKDHPPILSVQYDGKFLKQFSIYDPQNPSTIWLSESEKSPIDPNRTYNWMFRQTFWPQPGTRYIAVDLAALADAREIE